MHQRDFGRVALEVEHAFAEKRAPEPHAVETADQFFAIINFDPVAMADLVQPRVERTDARIDPGAGAVLAGRGAAVEHGGEVTIDVNLVTIRAHGAGEAARQVKVVERDDAALFRLDPVERGVVGILRHRKDAAGIGLEQHIRRDFDKSGFPGAFFAGHRT